MTPTNNTMKKNMNTFLIVLLATGFIYLLFFHKPVNTTENQLKNWFSSILSNIVNHLEKDIEQDNKGLYPHAGQHSFNKQGSIVYILLDKNGNRYDVSDRNPINTSSIMSTDGYKQLEQKVHALNLSIALKENEINTTDDDTESLYQEDDEHITDHLRYFTVTISGW